MYLPKHFQVDDVALLAALIEEFPLATVIGILDGVTEINHIPLLLSEDKTRLYGHVAKNNPLLKLANQKNLKLSAVFHGPNAYITPSWYPSKQHEGKVVPTWNYAVVHAEGQLSLIDDPTWLKEHVALMTNIYESTAQSTWKLEDAPETYIDSMLKAIVGIEIKIDKLVGKFKLSQNRPQEDYASVVDHLKQSPKDTLRQMLQYITISH